MKFIDHVHGNYIAYRRARALSKHLAEIIPARLHILDIGCGDGLVTHFINEIRPDINLRGLDIQERDLTYISVERFDGETIPYNDASFDGVMFVDVLHHMRDPMVLLREATRVARKTILIKDHTLDGLLAGPTLRAMDWIGNSRYDVSLPYNYWSKRKWLQVFDALGLEIGSWTTSLKLYPCPASWFFDRSLHFVARLNVSRAVSRGNSHSSRISDNSLKFLHKCPRNPAAMTEDGHKTFDVYAHDYDVALARGISVSGEKKDYFAQRRIEWLRDCLKLFSAPVATLMDFGCGTGSSSRLFFDILGIEHFVGTDQSPKCLELARREHGSERTQFLLFDEYQPRGQFDLVFCNGVFHHIPPAERPEAIDYVLRSLRPGGLFAFWENNPWNPGTRYVMSRIPFDQNAITLSTPEARQLLGVRGFEILRTDFLFIFPRILHWCRWVEPFFSRLPFGAQYQVLCRKPS
jgi:SAM-dependent methyltransferase